MKCPKCSGDLAAAMYKGIEVERCQKCEGMWLDSVELDTLEDIKNDMDDLKGTVVFKSRDTKYKCPHCQKNLQAFNYRLHDLELDYCQEHGYWLDKGEEERVLELASKEKSDTQRSVDAEAEWVNTLQFFRSSSVLDKLRDLFK